jgi:hypothetical protein
MEFYKVNQSYYNKKIFAEGLTFLTTEETEKETESIEL